ncbi:MAG TPA: branched-chain amino acid ABC transporter substrate-binding protein [Acidimicrobiales bacterium]|nr:branched-chain amino acid ABC transporter substrate-binding protein [Acidimicrobiales bacterium]
MPGSSKRRWRWSAVVALPLLLATACGGGDEEETGGGASQGTKVVKIGVIAPLSGDLTATGTGIQNSVELAIRQANEKNKVPGWRIELAAEDDAAKPDVGAQAAAKLASDSAVVGVVGTYNSSVALQVAPVLERANIVQISPANTNDTLTRGQNPASPVRPYKNYFRTATLDSLQGGFAADYASNDLKVKNVAIIHDKKAYGQGLADSFKTRFEKNGGRIVATETINPGDKDFSAVLSKIKPLNPDLIFYGGEYPEGSLISNQAKGPQAMRVPVMGGDGLVDATYGKTAGAAANGDYATSVGAPPEQLDSAKQFLADYKAANFRDPHTAFGALAYDAANAIINTLPTALGSATAVDDSVRRKVVEAVAKVDFGGASGKVAFDSFGDTVTRALTMYKVENGEFKPIKTGEFKA